jgi:DNA-binding MarR family transcriptional regulator
VKRKPQPPPAADHVLGLVHVLSSLIGRAFHARSRAAHHISIPEWRVLVTLANHPGSTAAEIVERWAMQPMMASRAIRQLKRRCWIERKVRHDDRRSYALWLTDKGRGARRRTGPTPTGATARFLWYRLLSIRGGAEDAGQGLRKH